MAKSPIHNTPAKILGLSPEELEKIKEQFPYFNAARMLLLKQRQDKGDTSEKELSSSAVWSSDRKKLHDFLKKKTRVEQPVREPEETPEYSPVEQQELNPLEVPVIHQEQVIEQPAPIIEEKAELIEAPETFISPPVAEATTLVIDRSETPQEEDEQEEEETSTVAMPEARKFIIADHTFDEWLDHFKRGKHSVKKLLEDKPKAAEEAADELNRLIESSLPATFFHDKLESETQYAKGLETFIEGQKKKKAGVSKPAETGLVTETLAKIYERQGLTDRAIGVYEQLILKNPEKSAYFAVQIERLKNK